MIIIQTDLTHFKTIATNICPALVQNKVMHAKGKVVKKHSIWVLRVQ